MIQSFLPSLRAPLAARPAPRWSALRLLPMLALASACSVVAACSGKDAPDKGDGNAGGAPGAGGAGDAGGAGGAGGGDPTTSSSSSAGGDPWEGPLESLAELDLGDASLGVTRVLPIPDRTLGFTVQATAASQGEVLGVARLRSPANVNVISDFAMTGHTAQVFGNYGWVGCADPQSDDAAAFPVMAGEWRMILGDDDGSLDSARVRLWVRRTNDGAFHGGVVDVNVFIAPGSGASTPYMSQVLVNMFPYAGLDLGNVEYFALPASFDVINSFEEYRQLLQASVDVGTAPALNLFVVGGFSGAEFPNVLGIAGGIPGSPMRHGTGQSGVAYTPSDPAYDASVLRHEVGHLGGLFHTTELQITESDPLSDTPVCPSQTIESNPDACPDVSNTMFPVAYGATDFTEGQRVVLRGSALYRGILDAGGAPAPPLPGAARAGGARAITAWSDDAILPSTPRAGVAAAGSAAAAQAGSAGLGPGGALERVLGAVWCARGGDYEALAIRVAAASGDAGARLQTIALDEKAPALHRGRALAAWMRAASPAERPRALATAAALVRDERAQRSLRVAALGALGRVDAARAAAAGRAVKPGGDEVVRDLAR